MNEFGNAAMLGGKKTVTLVYTDKSKLYMQYSLTPGSDGPSVAECSSVTEGRLSMVLSSPPTECRDRVWDL